ncbi:hypothetical protein TNCV_2628811 [Trichonephila clavipes]|uniref:Uncharacterized protein n=1 Tax=Trichonephila clavipes TaxID=2585209 RepID=A0A8X6SA29_TRICX|nr:hypothetical protein TNCV_2628811 [Trichonephila clavipes]
MEKGVDRGEHTRRGGGTLTGYGHPWIPGHVRDRVQLPHAQLVAGGDGRPEVCGRRVGEELRGGHHGRCGPGPCVLQAEGVPGPFEPVGLSAVVAARLGEVGVGGIVEVARDGHAVLRGQGHINADKMFILRSAPVILKFLENPRRELFK